MDRFFNRLGDVIKSFLDDEDHRLFGAGNQASSSGDPDLKAAFDELDDYLKADKDKAGAGGGRTSGTATGQANEQASPRTPPRPSAPGIPDLIRRDFAELGLAVGASEDECKSAYKNLLKIHHPDRHAGHPGNMKKATEKSSRINASYQRLEHWRATGKIE